MSERLVPCKVCLGEGLVCEDHPKKAWNGGDGCCGGAGMICKCNKEYWDRGGEITAMKKGMK